MQTLSRGQPAARSPPPCLLAMSFTVFCKLNPEMGKETCSAYTKDSNLTLEQKELQMHQLQDKGGAHISTVFYEKETGPAPRFKTEFRDVISKEKARSFPDRAQNNLPSVFPAG